MKFAPAFLASLFSAFLFAQPASAQNDPAKDFVISCSGPFAKNASHADIEKAFGMENVTYGEVPGPEGSTEKATIVFADNPERRLEIQWHDEEKRSRPASITAGNTDGQSRWSAPLGIRLGMPIAEVQKIAGKPFRINGFEWDLGGYAAIPGTKFEKLPGGCGLSLRFAPAQEIPEGKKYRKLVGDVKLRSDDKLLLEVKPVLQFFSIGYAE